jgi:hypothetical protein
MKVLTFKSTQMEKGMKSPKNFVVSPVANVCELVSRAKHVVPCLLCTFTF